MTNHTAESVLNTVQNYIKEGRTLKIRNVYNELSIFDWWPETLPIYRLKQMKSFLKAAIKLGYAGYVCFKVGASGCANGMWAYKLESTDGHSPDGDFLYRSFTPDYISWCACINNEYIPANRYEEDITSLKELIKAINLKNN